ncbi:MAG: hypothetical protein JW934_19145 [Anaerolineae bacterium]|nr:hypothetical protein [Anaerolineae bacterium]
MTQGERPAYTGIRTYRDPGGRFMFRYPKEWRQFELEDHRDGVMYSPESESPNTWFAVWASELPYPVMAADLDVLREGVNEGLTRLDDLHVEFESEDVIGNLCRFKRTYTLTDQSQTRKRQVWMIYVYRWLFVLTAQGDSPEAYQHWSMMLNDCLNSFDLADALWFASDPEKMPLAKSS